MPRNDHFSHLQMGRDIVRIYMYYTCIKEVIEALVAYLIYLSCEMNMHTFLGHVAKCYFQVRIIVYYVHVLLHVMYIL